MGVTFMCYMLYLGTDVVLPTSEFEGGCIFFLSDTDARIEVARQHFSKSHIYYAGSHTGCGCGFFFDENDGPDEVKQAKASVQKLCETIEVALQSDSSVELLVTWAGFEDVSPERRMEMTPDMIFADTRFPFDEGDFITFTKKNS